MQIVYESAWNSNNFTGNECFQVCVMLCVSEGIILFSGFFLSFVALFDFNWKQTYISSVIAFNRNKKVYSPSFFNWKILN